MSLTHKASLVIQTPNPMRFSDKPAPPDPTYKVGALTGKSFIPSCPENSKALLSSILQGPWF